MAALTAPEDDDPGPLRPSLTVTVEPEEDGFVRCTESGTWCVGDFFKINERGFEFIGPSTPASSSSGSSQASPSMSSSVSPEEEVGSLDELRTLAPLGQGSSGVVQKVLHVPTGRVLALKVLPLDLSEKKSKHVVTELRTLHASCCPQIVSFYGAFYREQAMSLVLEYMDGGSLSDAIKNGGPIEERHMRVIAEEVLKGLHYLHTERRIIHRDIKPSNLLLNKMGHVKIADFGVSGEVSSELDTCTNASKISFVGTVTYMSPERLQGQEHSFDSDIWSLGLSLAECALGYYPYLDPPTPAPSGSSPRDSAAAASSFSPSSAREPSPRSGVGAGAGAGVSGMTELLYATASPRTPSHAPFAAPPARAPAASTPRGSARKAKPGPGFWDIMERVVMTPPPTMPKDRFSPEFCSFVQACLQKNPKDRPTAMELLNHPFIKQPDASQRHGEESSSSSSSSRRTRTVSPFASWVRKLRSKIEQAYIEKELANSATTHQPASSISPHAALTRNSPVAADTPHPAQPSPSHTLTPPPAAAAAAVPASPFSFSFLFAPSAPPPTSPSTARSVDAAAAGMPPPPVCAQSVFSTPLSPTVPSSSSSAAVGPVDYSLPSPSSRGPAGCKRKLDQLQQSPSDPGLCPQHQSLPSNKRARV